jgi:hypothetical protein
MSDEKIAFLTLLVAAGAFALSLRQWQKGQEWQRAAKGRELIDDFLQSSDSDVETYAWDAMRMIDYQDEKRPFRTKTISGKRHEVFRKTIEEVLGNPDTDTDALLYIRECFDEFFFRLGQLQDAIDNDLVELKHVSCPIDYYVGVMAKDKDMKLYYEYMRDFHYERALEFLENFPDWEKARIRAKLPKVSEKMPARDV